MLVTVDIDIPKLEKELMELGKDYYLDNLKKVVFSNDFEKDVKKYTRREKSGIGIQKNEIGETLGRVLEDEEDNKYNIIVQLIAVPNLYRDENRNAILHLLQHELAHVHDYSTNYAFYKTFDDSETSEYALALISEYSADRFSAETNKYNEDYGINELKQWYLSAREIVEIYKANLCEESITQISRYHNQFLRELLSYLALIDGSTEDYIDAEKIVLEQLTFCIGKIDICKLHRELYYLFDKKNSKEAEELVINLSESYYRTYGVWGLSLEYKEDGLHIRKITQ